MQLLRTAIMIMLALVCCPSLSAMGKAKTKFIVSFHLETDENMNPKLTFSQMTNGKARFYRRMPEISTNDIVSFAPFPTDNGTGYGVVFKLKDNAARRLNSVTNMNQGRWLLAQVNGRVADGVMIDQPVSDGMIVVWKDVTAEDIALFEESLPRINEEKKKK